MRDRHGERARTGLLAAILGLTWCARAAGQDGSEELVPDAGSATERVFLHIVGADETVREAILQAVRVETGTRPYRFFALDDDPRRVPPAPDARWILCELGPEDALVTLGRAAWRRHEVAPLGDVEGPARGRVLALLLVDLLDAPSTGEPPDVEPTTEREVREPARQNPDPEPDSRRVPDTEDRGAESKDRRPLGALFHGEVALPLPAERPLAGLGGQLRLHVGASSRQARPGPWTLMVGTEVLFTEDRGALGTVTLRVARLEGGMAWSFVPGVLSLEAHVGLGYGWLEGQAKGDAVGHEGQAWTVDAGLRIAAQLRLGVHVALFFGAGPMAVLRGLDARADDRRAASFRGALFAARAGLLIHGDDLRHFRH